MKEGVRIICIDDFAFRKGQTYGTVMINAETGKVVDILDSRDYEDVRNWLNTFPDIRIVSRDGSQTYAKAIADSGLNRVQISDRFHLLKNLTEYAKKYLQKKLPGNVLINISSSVSYETTDIPEMRAKYQYKTKWELIKAVQKMRNDGYTINQICELLRIGNKTVMAYEKIREDQKEDYINVILLKNNMPDEKENQKAERIRQAKEMLLEGYSPTKASELLGVSERTIRRYKNADPSGCHGNKGMRRTSILDEYKDEILILASKGQSSTKIHTKIKEKGFSGSSAILRKFLHDYNIGEAQPLSHDEKLRIQRKDLISLLYKDISKVKTLKIEHLREVMKIYPEIETIYRIVKSFKHLLFSKTPERLDAWLIEMHRLDISEINSFVIGIENDLEAVKNAIVYQYSNGLAEGTVNKIKVIKRIMYGRCGFQMLRHKIFFNSKSTKA